MRKKESLVSIFQMAYNARKDLDNCFVCPVITHLEDLELNELFDLSVRFFLLKKSIKTSIIKIMRKKEREFSGLDVFAMVGFVVFIVLAIAMVTGLIPDDVQLKILGK